MADQNRIYLYPKTSCDCADCKVNTNNGKVVYDDSKGIPSNMSVKNCIVPSEFECANRLELKPPTESGPAGIERLCDIYPNIKLLNPQIYLDKYTDQFKAVECNSKGCESINYVSNDPRLFHGMRGYIALDARPVQSLTPLSQVYDEKLRGYGKHYSGYDTVSAGDITYYTGKERSSPYYAPLFDEKNKYSKVLYRDPMSAIKPEYPREVKNPTLVGDVECSDDKYCLSWIRDTQMQRDDILTSQMAKINQRRYEPRWV